MTATFRLIDHGWRVEFEAAGKLKTDDLLVISPFIKHGAVQRLGAGKKQIRVLTRFSLHDFAEGVSDLRALRHLLDVGAEVRGIKNLHAKMYVFGKLRGIVTSANLTDAAQTRNHELGFVTDDPAAIQSCQEYFERLWELAGKHSRALTVADLEKWNKEIKSVPAKRGGPPSGLHDYGANLGFLPDAPPASVDPTISTRAFVKFFGTSGGRVDSSTPVFNEVESSESHWSLSYPKTKRPRRVGTGDIMFIGRMVRLPNDTRIYGRVVAYAHQPRRDDASEADKKRRDWKTKWSTYIRVRDPEFIAGTLANGISLNEMMSKLGAKAFTSTEANERSGSGNTNPRAALRSKAHMELSQAAADWLNEKFYQSLAQHGRIPIGELEKLYWPELPSA